jgi:hypothetical protein
MTGRSSYLLAATATALMACTAIMDGCGSIACTETDTCPEGGSPGDETRPDVGTRDGSEDATHPYDATSADHRKTDANDADATERSDGEPGTDALTDSPPDSPEEMPADAPKDIAIDTGPADTGPADTGPKDTGPVDTGPPPPPTCVSQGLVCAPAWDTGSGWVGPVALYDPGIEGPPTPSPHASVGTIYTQALPASPTATSTFYYDLVGTTNLTCGCSCSGSPTVTCTNPTVSLAYEPCGDTTGNLFYGPATAPTACTSTGSGGGHSTTSITVALSATPPTGTCGAVTTSQSGAWTQVNGWGATVSAYWTGSAESAYPTGSNGCAATTDVCVPPPPSTFNGGAVCIFFDGATTCPTGYTAQYYGFSTGASDTQSCNFTACSCTATGLTCNPEVTVSSETTCSGVDTTTDLSIGCTNIANYGPPTYLSTTTTTGGSCTLSGSATSSGSVTDTAQQVTICCN